MPRGAVGFPVFVPGRPAARLRAGDRFAGDLRVAVLRAAGCVALEPRVDCFLRECFLGARRLVAPLARDFWGRGFARPLFDCRFTRPLFAAGFLRFLGLGLSCRSGVIW
ncbi:MAG: hypothetical protein Kow0056_15310 [Coriobacteriia bacterium]